MKQSLEFDRFLAFKTLLKKEVLRFMSVASQTMLAPLVTASLYLLIFGVSLGSKVQLGADYSYLQFVIPGLILMGAINNSFANASSSLFISRYIGNIVELLVTPIGKMQFIWAYILAAMLRASMVSTMIWLVSYYFSPTMWAHPFMAIVLLMLTTFLFACLGVAAAMVAVNFDTLSMFTNFLILPLIYLGGLFYPVSQLKGIWNILSQFNPIYYLIEGFRYAYLGQGDLSFTKSVLGAGIFALIAFFAAYKLSDRLRE